MQKNVQIKSRTKNIKPTAITEENNNSLFDFLKFGESYTSLILGIVVVVIAGIVVIPAGGRVDTGEIDSLNLIDVETALHAVVVAKNNILRCAADEFPIEYRPIAQRQPRGKNGNYRQQRKDGIFSHSKPPLPLKSNCETHVRKRTGGMQRRLGYSGNGLGPNGRDSGCESSRRSSEINSITNRSIMSRTAQCS